MVKQVVFFSMMLFVLQLSCATLNDCEQGSEVQVSKRLFSVGKEVVAGVRDALRISADLGVFLADYVLIVGTAAVAVSFVMAPGPPLSAEVLCYLCNSGARAFCEICLSNFFHYVVGTTGKVLAAGVGFAWGARVLYRDLSKIFGV